MNKYTFVVEYRKGTYIQQISAKTLMDSIKIWVEEINSFNIPNLGDNEKSILENEISTEKPINIAGMDNVWCIFLKVKKSDILVNIIETV